MNEEQKRVVTLFKQNEKTYKGKSDKFLLRITADELGMDKDSVMEILAEHYEE